MSQLSMAVELFANRWGHCGELCGQGPQHDKITSCPAKNIPAHNPPISSLNPDASGMSRP